MRRNAHPHLKNPVRGLMKLRQSPPVNLLERSEYALYQTDIGEIDSWTALPLSAAKPYPDIVCIAPLTWTWTWKHTGLKQKQI